MLLTTSSRVTSSLEQLSHRLSNDIFCCRLIVDVYFRNGATGFLEIMKEV